MQNKLISIIIINYNGLKWLEKCFNSILAQTYKNFEIIFVDNASIDDSVRFIEEKYIDIRIKIIKSKKNLGFAGGNNLGIKQAKGQYLLLLNNDTWVDSDFLEKMMKNFIQSNCSIMGPIEANYYTKKFKEYSIHLDLFGHSIYLFEKEKRNENFYLCGACLLLKKKTYFHTKGLDGNFFMYAEDSDWFWRLQLMNVKICKNNVLVYHSGAGSTGAGIKYSSFLWRNQNTLQMLLKNYKWYNLMWVLPVYFIQNVFEIIFFLFLAKPMIAYSYIEGWMFNIKNFGKIMKKRRWVQKNRVVGDFEIIKKMYIGFAKPKHLIGYYYEKFVKKNI